MILFFSGIIIGLVMGLTGAGGALIALPLFLHWEKMPLAEASVMSLVAVFTAAGLNFISTRKAADYRTAALIIPFTFLGSFLSAKWKPLMPAWSMESLIILLAVFALYTVWNPLTGKNPSERIPRLILAPFTGMLTGILTTLTGLGGGVILVPALRFFFSLPLTQSIATSFLLISVSALISFLFQWDVITINAAGMLSLVSGIFLAVLSLIFFLKGLEKEKAERIRKMTFSLVVASTIAGLLF